MAKWALWLNMDVASSQVSAGENMCGDIVTQVQSQATTSTSAPSPALVGEYVALRSMYGIQSVATLHAPSSVESLIGAGIHAPLLPVASFHSAAARCGSASTRPENGSTKHAAN